MELKNNPENAQALTYLADIKIRSNDDAAAEALLGKEIRLQNDIRLAYLDLGIVYANQKKDQEAIKALLHTVDLIPGSQMLITDLGASTWLWVKDKRPIRSLQRQKSYITRRASL